MTHHEIVKKLIGEINPVGETNIDNERFVNLKNMINLIENLLFDIDDLKTKYKNMPEMSIKRAVDLATKFSTTTLKDLAAE